MKLGTTLSGKFAILCLLIALCGGLTATARADTDTPTRKLGRGTANLLLFWWEIPRSWGTISGEYGEVAGITWGTAQGIGHGVLRIGAGIYDIFTFPYANGPLLYPEFVVGEDEKDVFRIREKDQAY